MVGVGLLALLGEVAVRLVQQRSATRTSAEQATQQKTYLNAVLETVELQRVNMVNMDRPSTATTAGEVRVPGCPSPEMTGRAKTSIPPSTNWRSGNRPGRLHARNVSTCRERERERDRETVEDGVSSSRELLLLSLCSNPQPTDAVRQRDARYTTRAGKKKSEAAFPKHTVQADDLAHLDDDDSDDRCKPITDRQIADQEATGGPEERQQQQRTDGELGKLKVQRERLKGSAGLTAGGEI